MSKWERRPNEVKPMKTRSGNFIEGEKVVGEGITGEGESGLKHER